MPVTANDWLIEPADRILITGANGFIGSKVVELLVSKGFSNLRCFGRAPGMSAKLEAAAKAGPAQIDMIQGNLLSRQDCLKAVEGVSVIFHLAAGNEKSFAGCYMNSVVTTRNLLEAARSHGGLKRFVNVSSFAVYNNMRLRRGEALDESCDVESRFMERYDAYCFGKVKQDEIVREYGRQHGLPYVILRPGAVYGPGVRQLISPRVGIDTFGIFLHLGGPNRVPLTYIDNCAEAIVLAGLTRGIDGEVFNVVDDAPPRSRTFLRLYKQNVGRFRSIYIPYRLFYLFSFLWEKYAAWSGGQLPPAFNRLRCSAYWKGNKYPNDKLKRVLNWRMKVGYEEGLARYFEFLRLAGGQK